MIQTRLDSKHVLAALLAAEDGKAYGYASRALQGAEEQSRDWNYGNAIHDGHRILGHVALRQGDTEVAKAHLRSAGTTPGSPQLRKTLLRGLEAIANPINSRLPQTSRLAPPE